MARHDRLQSSTRLDIVAIMLDAGKPSINPTKTGAKEDGRSSHSLPAMDDQRRVKERAAAFGEVRVIARTDRGK